MPARVPQQAHQLRVRGRHSQRSVCGLEERLAVCSLRRLCAMRLFISPWCLVATSFPLARSILVHVSSVFVDYWLLLLVCCLLSPSLASSSSLVATCVPSLFNDPLLFLFSCSVLLAPCSCSSSLVLSARALLRSSAALALPALSGRLLECPLCVPFAGTWFILFHQRVRCRFDQDFICYMSLFFSASWSYCFFYFQHC